MAEVADNPAVRAERLLRDVMGEDRFHLLEAQGHVDLPSRLVQGRTYRLDRMGQLLYRDAGDWSFRTTLCVQPKEDLPRDDVVAMRYLLVTADEERLLEVANPIAFGFVALARALHHDFCQRFSSGVSALLTGGLILFFLAAAAAELWMFFFLLPHRPALAILLLLLLMVPAFIGSVLVIAAFVEASYFFRAWRLSGRMKAEG